MPEVSLRDLASATKWKKAITKTQRKELEEQALSLLNALLKSPKLEDMFYDGVVLGQSEYGNGSFELVLRKNGTLETVNKTYAESTKATLTRTEKHVIEPENYPKQLETFNVTAKDICFLISLF